MDRCCCDRNIILAEISERTTHKTRKKVSRKSVGTEEKMSGIVNIKTVQNWQYQMPVDICKSTIQNLVKHLRWSFLRK